MIAEGGDLVPLARDVHECLDAFASRVSHAGAQVDGVPLEAIPGDDDPMLNAGRALAGPVRALTRRPRPLVPAALAGGGRGRSVETGDAFP